MSRKSALTALICMLTSIPLVGPSAATETKVQAMTGIHSNIFYRAALIASQLSGSRKGQMTDVSEGVRPLFSGVTPGELGRQLGEIERHLSQTQPGRVQFNPDKIVAQLEEGNAVYLGFEHADLKALFGPTAPFHLKDEVVLEVRKSPDGPNVEIEKATLVNKTRFP